MTQSHPHPSSATTLARINEEFRAARGDKADEDWARSAQARLMLDDVSPELVISALADLAPLLREADEPAEQLFGPAGGWANEQQKTWRESGVQAYRRDDPLSAARFLSWTFSLALWITVLTTIAALVGDGWGTDLDLLMFVLPLGIALVSISILQAWRLAMRKLSRPAGVAVTGIVLVASAAALGGIAVATTSHLGTGATLWLLAPVPVYALLASVSRLIDQRVRRHRAGDRDRHRLASELASALPDESWVDALTEQLRLRRDRSEEEIRGIVAEARTYAQDAGSTLHDEFGTPDSYAARFRPNECKKARFEAIGWSASALLTGALTGLSISASGTVLGWATALYALLFVATTIYAVVAWHRSRTSV